MHVRRSSRVLAVLVTVAATAILLAACQLPWAVLRGRVTTTAGTNVAGVAVVVYSNTAATIVAQTTTDAEGDYSFLPDQLPDGTYRIRFAANTWWQGASSWATATPVTVTAASPVGIDVTADVTTGSVAGVVTVSGQPASGVEAVAINTVSSSSVATTTTTPNGSYSFGTLPAGTYVFLFRAAGLTTRYNSSALTQAAAPKVTVTGGATITGINTTLATENTITGRVTDGINPLANVFVVAIEPTSGQPVAFATTGADGTFRLGTLNVTLYTLTFVDLTGVMQSRVFGPIIPILGTINVGTIVMTPNA